MLLEIRQERMFGNKLGETGAGTWKHPNYHLPWNAAGHWKKKGRLILADLINVFICSAKPILTDWEILTTFSGSL